MKKILVVLLAALALIPSLSGQEQPLPQGEMLSHKDSIAAVKNAGAHRKGAGIKLDGVKLDESQRSLLLSDIDFVDYNADWAKCVKRHRLGNGLIIGGSCAMGIGVVAGGIGIVYALAGTLGAALTLGKGDVSPIFNTAGDLLAAGTLTMAAGTCALCVGVPVKVKAHKKMNAICNSYNNATQRVEKEVIFGTTASGVGLVFNF